MKSKTPQSQYDSSIVQRLPFRFAADERWVVTRPFCPGGETRIRNIAQHVQELPESQAGDLLEQIRIGFYSRHREMELVLLERFDQIVSVVPELAKLSAAKKLLVGAYFTMEYSFASTALFNPSIVFRSGVITDHHIDFDPPSEHCFRMRQSPDRQYQKQIFQRKLRDLVADKKATNLVLKVLPDSFTFEQLESAIEQAHEERPDMYWLAETTESMDWLARENYRLTIPPQADISEMVVFPQSDNEIMGIEDLRMVRFVEDNGQVIYYGTYTAYNGSHALPQLMKTTDFHHLEMNTLNGSCVQNKGFALFPRRIGGRYCMSSRIDGENLFIMYSDVVEFWESAEMLPFPKQPWEFMQSAIVVHRSKPVKAGCY